LHLHIFSKEDIKNISHDSLSSLRLSLEVLSVVPSVRKEARIKLELKNCLVYMQTMIGVSENSYSFALHAKFRRQITMKFSVQLLQVSVFVIYFVIIFWLVIYLVPFLFEIYFGTGQSQKRCPGIVF